MRATSLAPEKVATLLRVVCTDEPRIIDRIFKKYIPDANKPEASRLNPFG